MGRQRKPFCRSWYNERIREYFESDFLKSIGSSVSDYIYASEQIELLRIESQAKERLEKWKKENTEPQLSKIECFEYFKKLSTENPLKYEKILDMLGIEKGQSLYQIMFGKKERSKMI